MHKFGVGEYVTRDGRKAVVVADNIPNEDCPLLGWVISENGKALGCGWSLDGRFSISATGTDLVPPKVWRFEMDQDEYDFIKNGGWAFSVANTGPGFDAQTIVDRLNAGESE